MTIGRRNSTSTLAFCSSGRIIVWLTFIGCGLPPNCAICMLCCTKYCEDRDVEVAEEQREEPDRTMYAIGDAK